MKWVVPILLLTTSLAHAQMTPPPTAEDQMRAAQTVILGLIRDNLSLQTQLATIQRLQAEAQAKPPSPPPPAPPPQPQP